MNRPLSVVDYSDFSESSNETAIVRLFVQSYVKVLVNSHQRDRIALDAASGRSGTGEAAA